MSIPDPADERERPDGALKGSGRVAAVFGVVLSLIGGVLGGFALGAVIGAFRDMTINYDFDMTMGGSDPVFFMVGMFGGTGAWFAGGLLCGRAAERLPGRMLTGTFHWGFLGTVVGSAYASSRWAPAARLGEVHSVEEGRSFGAWTVEAWVFYHASWWLPALLGVVTVLTVLLPYAYHQRQDRLAVAPNLNRADEDRRIAALERTGTAAQGVVSEVESTGKVVRGRPVIRLTVAYDDETGERRWVTRTAEFEKPKRPRLGDAVTVLTGPGGAVLIKLGPERQAHSNLY